MAKRVVYIEAGRNIKVDEKHIEEMEDMDDDEKLEYMYNEHIFSPNEFRDDDVHEITVFNKIEEPKMSNTNIEPVCIK